MGLDMGLEVIGVVTFVVGLCALMRGPVFGMWSLAISTLFGAAAAIKLPDVGGASVPPAPIIAFLFVLAVAARPRMRASALACFAAPQPGFWLLLFTVYAVLAAYFLPRIFAGMTFVYSLARNGGDFGIVTLPLAARASNFTQAGYLVVNLLCFAAVAGYAVGSGIRDATNAILAAAVLLLVFAVADLATHYTHTSELLSFIRNANYRMLEAGEIGGFKRIVGSFTEAGAYSYAALGFYAFALNLWLARIRVRLTGTLAALLGLSLLLSTSTTAYASFAIYSAIVLVSCLTRLSGERASRQDLTYVIGIALVPLLLFAAALLLPSAWQALSQMFDATVANKLATQSGVERMRWNEHALRSFIDTLGFGAGTGSVRASSILVALLANVGVIGLVLFVALTGSIALRTPPTQDYEHGIWRAASGACIALVIAACISAGSVDLGLPFSIFAGLAAAVRRRRRSAAGEASDRFVSTRWLPVTDALQRPSYTG